MSSVLTAYARAMGISLVPGGDPLRPVVELEYGTDLEGRPGKWHGGAIAGLLETAGYAVLRAALDGTGRDLVLKPITITVEYLSTGRPQASYARGRVVRLGRRNANLSVEAWQDDPSRPIATAVMNVLMTDDAEDAAR